MSRGPRKHFTFKQASALLSLSENTIRKLLTSGILRGLKTPGGHWRLDEASVHAYLASRDAPGALIQFPQE